MKSAKRLRNFIIYVIITIAIMGVIFYFSSENKEASAGSSGSFKELLLNIISPILPDTIINFIDEYIRKIAHFVLYFSLGITTSLAAKELYLFKNSDREVSIIAYAFAFIVCVVYAISDEIHQYFVPGRSGKLIDVLLDAGGSITAILIVGLISALIYIKRKKSAT